MRFRIAYGTVFVLCTMFSLGVCPAQDDDDLGENLGALDRLRRGKDTPFQLIDTECEKLLKQYPRAEDQGRIYAHLAHVYAQTGMRRPGDAQRVIDNAKKALEKPLEPRLRLRMFLYWGDAHVRSDPSDLRKSFFDGRAAAASAYFKGLKEAQQYNIPEVAPEIPTLSFPSPPKKGDGKDFLRQMEALQPKLQRIKVEREMHMYRSCLQGQLLFLYTRRPYAGSELRRLATEILGDPGQVEKLMKAVPSEALKDETPPKPK